MHFAKLSTLRVSVAVLILVTSAAAQQIRFEDFSSTQNLDLNGRTHQATWNGQQVLRLTDGIRMGTRALASSVWFDAQQPLQAGFTSYFAFQIHNPAGCCTPGTPGDGLAFVIQNSSGTDYCATGAGTTALGVPSGGMGYTGIRNSLAIEFDTAQDSWDPNANHIAMQSCGTQANSPAHVMGSFPICGGQYMVSSCLVDPNGIDSGNDLPHLGLVCGQGGCQDGAVHQVVVEYTGSSGNRLSDNPGNIKIYVDPPFMQGTHTPAPNAVPQINLTLTIENTIALNSGAAYVGFTASQASTSQTTDLLAWEYTPHQDTKIQELIQNGGTQTTFSYGGHLYGVTYPQDFMNSDNDYMTVDAILIDKQTFYLTRLVGTQFSNEQCLTYLQTGGNCVIYEVTCQKSDKMTQIPCPNPDNNQLIDVLTTYTTSDDVTAQNADYIKATIGQNDWISIFTGFSQNDIDPTTSGKGKDFSDFVATFKPHGGNASH